VPRGDNTDTVNTSLCVQKILTFVWQWKKSDTVKGYVFRM